ncbi:hypothetical protein ACL9RL_06170 [Plantibacter sp. Mn2098]|uniref:hypothetical protein n=1 Tax=Plantibacter sp. Mn2098 TaxID=3395266 RepID=UPI003BC8C0F0
MDTSRVEGAIEEILRRNPMVETVYTDAITDDAYTFGVIAETATLYLSPSWEPMVVRLRGT